MWRSRLRGLGVFRLDLPGLVLVFRHEVGREDRWEIACSVQDAIDFDSILDRPVENEIISKASERKITQIGEEWLFGMVASADARVICQPPESSIRIDEETIGGP